MPTKLITLAERILAGDMGEDVMNEVDALTNDEAAALDSIIAEAQGKEPSYCDDMLH